MGVFDLYSFVLWDLDNTLLDPHPPERASIRNCFRDFNLGQCTDAMLDTYPAINNRWWTMCERGEKSKEEILVGRFVEFLGQFGLRTDIAAEFASDYMERLGDTICPIDGAMETLKALKGRVKQYLVTNGVWASQRKKVQNSGIDKIIDGIFVSEDIGFEKPEKRIYQIVFERIGCDNPAEAIMVGDSLTTDIRGANNAGIACCWFNPKGKEKPSDIRVDYEIRRIPEVLGILGI